MTGRHIVGASAVLRREVNGQTVYEPFWLYEDHSGLFIRFHHKVVRLHWDKTTSDPAWTIFQLSSDNRQFVEDHGNIRAELKTKRRARVGRTTNNYAVPRRFVGPGAGIVVAFLGGFLWLWTSAPALGALHPYAPSRTLSLTSQHYGNWCCRTRHPLLRGSIL